MCGTRSLVRTIFSRYNNSSGGAFTVKVIFEFSAEGCQIQVAANLVYILVSEVRRMVGNKSRFLQTFEKLFSPQSCPKCATELTELAAGEAEDDWCFFRVWCCLECYYCRLPAYYKLVDINKFCSKCYLPTMKLYVKLTRKPSHIRTGEIHVLKECKRCKCEKHSTLVLPILQYNHQPRSNGGRIGGLQINP